MWGHMAHSDKAYVNQNPSDPARINLWNVSIQLHQGGPIVTVSFMVSWCV